MPDIQNQNQHQSPLCGIGSSLFMWSYLTPDNRLLLAIPRASHPDLVFTNSWSDHPRMSGRPLLLSNIRSLNIFCHIKLWRCPVSLGAAAAALAAWGFKLPQAEAMPVTVPSLSLEPGTGIPPRPGPAAEGPPSPCRLPGPATSANWALLILLMEIWIDLCYLCYL